MDGYPLSEPLDCYYLNVWNTSSRRGVKVTHVWVELPGGSYVAVLTKPLPVVVAPEHQWETWIDAAYCPADTDVEYAARARLSDRRVIVSVPRRHVPPVGPSRTAS
jgi:hypothetical protein